MGWRGGGLGRLEVDEVGVRLLVRILCSRNGSTEV